jgi:VWFA-related protein
VPRSVCLAAALFVLVGVAGSIRVSGELVQFRSTGRSVPVYVTVIGPDGRLVTDLTRDDFEIYDEGVRQEITVFSNDLQPITVVMMLDRSGSVASNFRLVQDAAAAFVDRLLPEDKARIGSFSNRVQVDPREFTSDKDEMRTILATELQEPGATPLWNAIDVAMTALLRQEGRRVVLVFTDGRDMPPTLRPTNISEGYVKKRSREEDVMVYGIGLTGMNPGRGGRGRVRTTEPDEGLIELAAESGGGYFPIHSTDNLGETFARVADELHRQYLLGFVPQKLDGKMHDVEVRLKPDGMTARARQSYLAPKKK